MLNNNLKGGEFLIKEQTAQSTFIPEQVNEEQKMFRDMTRDFLEKEVTPLREKIDKQLENPDLVPEFMHKIAELGIVSFTRRIWGYVSRLQYGVGTQRGAR